MNDLILDAEGQKMSKSSGNTVDPWDAIADHGTDAIRWYLITSSNPWVAKRYDPAAVQEASRKFLDTLFNTYRFFTLYANAEDWSPSRGRSGAPGPKPARPLADFQAECSGDGGALGAERLSAHAEPTGLWATFLSEELSNWYVRRSRPGSGETRTRMTLVRRFGRSGRRCAPFASSRLR